MALAKASSPGNGLEMRTPDGWHWVMVGQFEHYCGMDTEALLLRLSFKLWYSAGHSPWCLWCWQLTLENGIICQGLALPNFQFCNLLSQLLGCLRILLCSYSQQCWNWHGCYGNELRDYAYFQIMFYHKNHTCTQSLIYPSQLFLWVQDFFPLILNVIP